MKDGDLSNVRAPRIVVVFEGLIGSVPPGLSRTWNKAARKNDWHQAARQYEMDPLALAKLTDLSVRLNQNVEVVTYEGPQEMADELEIILTDTEMIPVSRVLASTPERTGRRATLATDIRAVYDPDERRWLSYGSKGVHVTSIHQVGR